MAFEVELEDLRTSAQAARDALRVVEDTTAPEDLRGITSGMPGASAVSLVGTVATGWESDITAWVTGARGYADGLDSARTRYEADDEAARRAFTPQPGAPGPEPR